MRIKVICGLFTIILFCVLGVLAGPSFGQDLETGIVELNEGNFQKEVLESDKLIVIEFWAIWCSHCKILSPIIERLAVFNQKYNRDKIRWFKVDVDKSRKFLDKFRPFRGLPVVVFYKNSKEVYRFIGALPFLKIQDVINSLLKEERKEKKNKKKDDCSGGTCEPPSEHKKKDLDCLKK